MDDGPRALSIIVTTGLITLAVALATASVLGLVPRHRAGRFRAGQARPAAGLPRKADLIAALGSVIG